MNLEQLLLALRARYLTIVAVAVVTLVGALVVTLLTPKSYVAAAAVVVDVKYADPIAGSILPALTQPSYMATQLDIIQSDRVASKVVTMLKLDQKPGANDMWVAATGGKGTLQSWLAGTLRGGLDVKPTRDSNVIAITWKGRNPQFAADVANAFAQAYIDTSVALRVEPARRYSTYFDTQAQAARDRLEKAQTALSAFQRNKGILVANDDRYDVESNRLAELSTQLSALQAQKADSQSRENQVKSSTSSLPEVLASPLVQSLKSEVARQEAKVQQMSGNFGPNNPELQRAQAELQSLRAKLGGETQAIANGVVTNNRINAQREGELRASLDAQKARLLKLKEDRDSAAVLQRDVDQSQRAFDAISQRQTQSNLESQTNQTNIAILNPAIEPQTAAGPRLLVNLVLALFAGTLLGVGAALLIEQLDRRVRSMSDLSRALGVPVLGSSDGAGGAQGRLIAKLSRPPPAAATPAPRRAAHRNVTMIDERSKINRANDGFSTIVSAYSSRLPRQHESRSIGAILIHSGRLSPEQTDAILNHQRLHGVPFGEAAIRLGVLKQSDIDFALSQQFDYPYLIAGQSRVSSSVVAAYDPFSPAVEALRSLRTQLLLRLFGGRGRLAITSANAGEGRSYLAANLAVVFSQLGEKTLLIDADLRAPAQHQIFGLESRAGLSSILSGRSELEAIQRVPALMDMSVLTSGPTPPNPQELVGRPVFSRLLEEVSNIYDVVVIDTPAAGKHSEALTIASRAGAALIVARKDVSRVAGLQDLTQSLSNAHVQVVGAVLSEF